MKTCLEIKNLDIAYENKTILHNISIQIDEGSIFGYLGPSGSGKTTTIKAITQQLKIKSGSVEIYGEKLSHKHYKSIGIMTDSNEIYENLSVYENVSFFAKLRKVSDKDILDVIERVGLKDNHKTKAKKLSKGMRQRLIMATALVHKPALLFLDEPTASLDPKTTHGIHELLIELNKQGTTIFLCTHSMLEAEKLCTQLAFLDQGQIVEQGSVSALKNKYAENRVEIIDKEGIKYTTTKDSKELQEILNLTQQTGIQTIHSYEPSLESIFLNVTGRTQYEII